MTKIENEVKGLYFRKDRGYWIALISVDNKQINLGGFANKEDAINARLDDELKYHPFYGNGTQFVKMT